MDRSVLRGCCQGIGGDEKEWTRGGPADGILDNLDAERKFVPMIVVLPNGRAKGLAARSPFDLVCGELDAGSGRATPREAVLALFMRLLGPGVKATRGFG